MGQREAIQPVPTLTQRKALNTNNALTNELRSSAVFRNIPRNATIIKGQTGKKNHKVNVNFNLLGLCIAKTHYVIMFNWGV